MKKTDRILSIVVAVCVAFCLSACVKFQQAEEKETSSATASVEENIEETPETEEKAEDLPITEPTEEEPTTEEPTEETAPEEAPTPEAEKEEEKKEEKAPAHTHSYTKKVVKPTCTTKGYTLHTCSCGKSYKDNTRSTINHSFGEWTITLEATEKTNGLKVRKCNSCDYTEEETIKKTGYEKTPDECDHSWSWSPYLFSIIFQPSRNSFSSS